MAQTFIVVKPGIQILITYNNIEQPMDEDFLSIKIKDGLFIGNKWTASDLEFLVANRFKYVLNCTSEIKNYFEASNFIKYYKLKYSKSKPNQLLWKDNMKKLNKIMEFINTAEEDAECCLIHSNEGNNRCIAVVIAYLMVKYKWKLLKVLQFLQSKNIENRITENYIKQLRALEEMLMSENLMSSGWSKENLSQDQLVMTNTYLNSIEIPFKKANIEHNNDKRVQWKDRIQKTEKQRSKKQLLRQEPKEKPQKRPAKSQIVQMKRQQIKQPVKQLKEKQKNSHRPSSSFSKSYTKKNKDEELSQKPRQLQKEEQELSGDSSTDDRPHNNRLINNFMNVGDEPKRTSKMAPRKSQENIKMLRAFSQKDYNSFKESSNKNMNVNTSKQSLKAAGKAKQAKSQAPKHFKSMHDGKIRATSPKTNIRYKN